MAAQLKKKAAPPARRAEMALTPEREYWLTTRKALARNFQRTQADLVVRLPENAQGYSMDAACAGHEMPDVYGVSNLLSPEVMGFLARQGFIGHQACALLSQQWLINKACTQPARDAVQHGYTLTIAEAGERQAEIKEAVEDEDRRLDVLGHCREFVRNTRIFGIRHALFIVDGLDYSLPFNPDGVAPGSYKGISQIDPYWLMPELAFDAAHDPSDMHFYEPTFWRLPNGTRIHRSHFVLARRGDVPDVLKPTYLFGGMPLVQEIMERVYAAERTANEAPELALTKRLLAIQGSVENMLTNEEETRARLHTAARLRDNYGFFCYGEDEHVVQIDTSLADFDALIMTQYQLVASIANVPATKLFGTQPKGFNATGEHETQSYDDEQASIQTNDMSPLVARHYELLERSFIRPNFGAEISVKHAWNKRPATPEQLAELNSKKANTGQVLINAGAIMAEEERARVLADDLSGYAHLEIDADETGEADLDTDMAALLADLNGETDV